MSRITCFETALLGLLAAGLVGQTTETVASARQRSMQIVTDAIRQDRVPGDSFWATAALSTRNTVTAKQLISESLGTSPGNALAIVKRVDPRLAQELLPVLERELNEALPQHKALFAGVIARAPGDRALADLSRCAEDSQGDLSGVCLGALEEIGEHAAQTLRSLASEGQSSARAVALRILGDRVDKSLRPIFERGLLNQDPPVRLQAALALAKLGDGRGAEVLRQTLRSTDDWQAVAATIAMVALGDQAMTDKARAWLAGDSVPTRVEVVRELAKYEVAPTHLLLAPAFKDALPEVRAAAVDALGNQRTPRTAPGLHQFILDEDSRVRLAAATVLASREGDAKALKELAKAAQGSDIEIRRSALEHLLGQPSQFLALFRSSLHDEDPIVRVTAIRGIAAAGDVSDISGLVSLTEDSVGDVVLEATNAIVKLSPDDAIPRLSALLDSHNRRAVVCAAADVVNLTENGK